MDHDKNIIICQLNSILINKNFSKPAKQEILKAISFAWDFYQNEKDKKVHFETIVASLKNVEVFKINTRKQLKKYMLTSHLGELCNITMGFTTKDNKIVAITKDHDYYKTIYHELIHLTQAKNAYQLDSSYFFSFLLSFALIEGEAGHYDRDFALKSNVYYSEIISDGDTQINIDSEGSYPLFTRIYELFLMIYGQSFMDQWKQGNFQKDILLELENKESQQTSTFQKFYTLIIQCLYKYFKYKAPKNKDYEILFIKSKMQYEATMQTIQSRINLLKEDMSWNHSRLKQIKQELKENNIIINDPVQMEVNFQKILAEQKKELENYQKDPDMKEDIYEEWQNDIVNATLKDYENHLKDLIQDLQKEFQEENVLLQKACQEYEELIKTTPLTLEELENSNFKECFSNLHSAALKLYFKYKTTTNEHKKTG